MPTRLYTPTLFDPADYPQPWQVAPTNRPDFREWYASVDWSLVPNIRPKTGNTTYPSGDPDCWWTRGSCTTPKRDGIQRDVTSCVDPNVMGLTLDDGPQCNSEPFYDFLKQNNQKVSLFFIGSNVHRWSNQAKRAADEGHHIAIHTWSHTPLTSLTNEQVAAGKSSSSPIIIGSRTIQLTLLVPELWYTQKIIKDVTGLTPLSWRPPTGDLDDRIRAIAQSMGLLPADIWAADTLDWRKDSAVEGNYQAILRDAQSGRFSFGGPVVLAHELDDFTMGFVRRYLPRFQEGFEHVVPVATCRNEGRVYAEENVRYPNMQQYLAGRTSPINSTTTTTTTTTTTLAATTASPLAQNTRAPEPESKGAGSGAGRVVVGGVLGALTFAVVGLIAL
ncbi:hypothetical protein HK097_010039 [Rhizophlyctis rosea]|uniref:NodB homology domain-containing protein n=1 Tax=Rhizophlyctis rosea TaxID=64517 RepID=A0AAD5S853_9FUNG|nr:hypothetical protein HK097_010039 [Rhizophlyctis rosea]